MNKRECDSYVDLMESRVVMKTVTCSPDSMLHAQVEIIKLVYPHSTGLEQSVIAAEYFVQSMAKKLRFTTMEKADEK